jgi:hypothetical protein
MTKTAEQIQEAVRLWSDEELRTEIQNYPDHGPRSIPERHLHIALCEADRRGLKYQFSC